MKRRPQHAGIVRGLVILAICYQVSGCTLTGGYSSGDLSAGLNAGGAQQAGGGLSGVGMWPNVPAFGTPFAQLGSGASSGGSWYMGGGGSSGFSSISVQQDSITLAGGGGGP